MAGRIQEHAQMLMWLLHHLHLIKDRCTSRRCNHKMYASLAMHSRAHQDFIKETGILGMCMGERKDELTNDRKQQWQTAHGHTCAGHLSLFVSPSFSLISSIHPFYRDDIVASLLSFILFPILFFLRSSWFLYYRSRFTLIPRFSPISYLYSPQQSSAHALSFRINLPNKILMYLKNIRANHS